MTTLKPSPYQLPQHCSMDRQRARVATLAVQRSKYRLSVDAPLESSDGEKLYLPPHLVDLPPEEVFTPKKRTGFALNKLRIQLNSRLLDLVLDFGLTDYRGYAGLSRVVDVPLHAARNWRSDHEFARQRLAGCSPMQLRRCRERPNEAFIKPVQELLAARYGGVSLDEILEQGRLFEISYPELAHPLVRASAQPGVWVTAPTALFYASPREGLMPLAIQLEPSSPTIRPNSTRSGRENNLVFTPLGPNAEWLYARSHVQAADGALHEGVHHLLNTHLVAEICAVVSARQLHPHHPISQLLTPHFQFTLAINHLARHNLLTVGGPIDRAVGARIFGVLATVAQRWRGWDFWSTSPMRDFESRGVDDHDTLPDYHFRNDAIPLWVACYEYVRDIIRIWYPDAADIRADTELQAWAAELAAPDGGNLHGFPSTFDNIELLVEALTEIIYRASVMHAAVNNGQYERYGWIPYSPAAMRPPPPTIERGVVFEEHDLWWCLPNRDQSKAQMGMAWILSAPTTISLVQTGEVPAFDPDLNPEAARAVGLFRRRLRELSAQIRVRNAKLPVPYTYLDPYNIARSTEV